jgi:hypothetical protein
MKSKNIGKKKDYEPEQIKKSDFDELMDRADHQFEMGYYQNALKLYSFVLLNYPDSKYAKIGATLSDIAMENELDAIPIFAYYQTLRDLNNSDILILENMIDSIYENGYSSKITSDKEVEALLMSMESSQEGIKYEDFLNIVKSRGDFKRSLEDTMFSTKIIISDKSEFIDFIKHLINSGYKDVALSYLDDLADSFGMDREIYNLYNLINAMDSKSEN